MINLNISSVHKDVTINGKHIKIPKLGLRHKMDFDYNVSAGESLKKLMMSIHPSLSVAERDLAILHLLEYNGRIPESKTIDGFTYSINDAFISQKLKFNVNGYEFKFKSPGIDKINGPANMILSECCVHVKDPDGNKVEIPDFAEAPAYTYKWIEAISTTISINGPNGTTVKGLYNILEILNERIIETV